MRFFKKFRTYRRDMTKARATSTDLSTLCSTKITLPSTIKKTKLREMNRRILMEQTFDEGWRNRKPRKPSPRLARPEVLLITLKALSRS